MDRTAAPLGAQRLLRLTPLLALVFILSGVPLIFLVTNSFNKQPIPGFGEPGFTLEHYAKLASDEFIGPAINTVIYAIAKTAIVISGALTLAWITVRTNVPFKRFIDAIVILPALLPSTMYYVGWGLLLSPRGSVNRFLQDLLGLGGPPINAYSLGGVIIAGSMHVLPLLYLILRPALINLNPEYEEAARLAGSSSIGTYLRVNLPLLRPAALIATIISFVKGIESFTPFIFLGAPARINSMGTKMVEVMQRQVPPDFGFATAIGVFLVALTAGFLYLYRKATQMTRRYVTITGIAYRPRPMDLGRARYLVGFAVMTLLLLISIPPIFMTVINSFLPFGMPLNLDIFRSMTLAAYTEVFNDPLLFTALGNTVFLLVSASLFIMFLATIITYTSIRTKIPGKSVLYSAAVVPLAVPGVALGLAVLWTYVATPLYGTVFVLIIAATAKLLPNAVAISSQVMHQIGGEIEEVSRVTGASWQFTFGRIILPLSFTAFLPGLSYLMVNMIGELDYVILLRTSQSEVLATMIWSNWVGGYLPIATALGTITLVLGFVAFFIPRVLEGRLWVTVKARRGRP